jgi:nucleoside-diphosphate-sugar epimerase
MKKIVVCGAGGFIGSHLVTKLKAEGHFVIGADLKYPEYSATTADEFYQYDLRSHELVEKLLTSDVDEVYQLAADMGGAGYVFTGLNDADIMHNSCQINMNVLDVMRERGIKKVLYTSSACIYPEHNQTDPDNPNCEESSAYPANPDSDYGWEKLFSERLYAAYGRNYGIDVRIVRFHNVFGPEGTWDGGREKSPAAFCRKVALCPDGGTIDMWGHGKQTRSFLFITQAVEGLLRVMSGSYNKPINLGSDRMISMNGLVELVAGIAGKKINVNHIPGPLGVQGRNSDNRLIKEKLGWAPETMLDEGIAKTYHWIVNQIHLRDGD